MADSPTVQIAKLKQFITALEEQRRLTGVNLTAEIGRQREWPAHYALQNGREDLKAQ